MKETKHWYLPLDKHEGWLRKWILEDHKEWRPTYTAMQKLARHGMQHVP
jgi:methionyl-tRNA synthetase